MANDRLHECIRAFEGLGMASTRHVRASAALIMPALGLCTAVSAVEFAGGTGEPNDPYQIATAEQLIAIGADPNLPSKHFVLIADIDLSGVTLSHPVVGAFNGTFDGRGHAICNLTIRADGRGYVGLFGMIGWAGRISDLHVVDADITASGRRNYHGVLAGYNDGTLVDCSATGILVTASNNDGNGLTGSGFGKQTNCRADVAIFKVWLGP